MYICMLWPELMYREKNIKTYLYNAHAPLSAADDNIKKTQFNITIRRKGEQIESAHKHDWIWINDNVCLFPYNVKIENLISTGNMKWFSGYQIRQINCDNYEEI